MAEKNWTRRQVLRGTGVALSLPWLESLAPRTARAQAADVRKRFITMYFSNGTAAFWTPGGAGAGETWRLSPIQDPLAALKSKVLAVSNISNTTPFITATDVDGTKPRGSHGALSASTWTAAFPNGMANGISVDQVVADTIAAGTNPPPLHSLQVGLSTVDSFTDGLAAPHSRSMSWKSATEPLYKVINPQAVFDRLMGSVKLPPSGGANVNPTPDPLVERRRALGKSSLDYVRQSAASLQPKLGGGDRQKLDQFLDSVRDLEKRVSLVMPAQVPASCKATTRHTAAYAVGAVPADYNRGTHAAVMTDLIVMALQCDVTRVVSYMLDDARSEFVYKFLTQRQFTTTGSSPGTGGCDQYHALQHAGETNNGFATIGWWMVQKTAELAAKLAAVSEGPAGSMLDNTVILLASGMHGSNHKGTDIPVLMVGNAGGALKQDVHIPFPAGQQIANLHLTLIQKVFGGKAEKFGSSTGIIPELLA